MYFHQEQVPRKQGLKHSLHTGRETRAVHQEQVPRKQGLKLDPPVSPVYPISHQEQVPRKQGLKLLFDVMELKVIRSSRASSTKTRIETSNHYHSAAYYNHQEQVPRKQGLKQKQIAVGIKKADSHQEQVPRKQGLKQDIQV